MIDGNGFFAYGSDGNGTDVRNPPPILGLEFVFVSKIVFAAVSVTPLLFAVAFRCCCSSRFRFGNDTAFKAVIYYWFAVLSAICLLGLVLTLSPVPESEVLITVAAVVVLMEWMHILHDLQGLTHRQEHLQGLTSDVTVSFPSPPHVWDCITTQVPVNDPYRLYRMQVCVCVCVSIARARTQACKSRFGSALVTVCIW